MASIVDARLHCMNCHNSFSSSAELSRHLNQRECYGIADGTLADAESNSDSEWEYEYSSIETEILYVTLDLPVARSDANIEEGPKGGRLTRRKDKWLNSTHMPFIDDKRRLNQGDGAEDDESDIAENKKKDNRKPSGKGTAFGNNSKRSVPMAGKVKRPRKANNDADADGETDEELSSLKDNGMNRSKSTTHDSQEKGASATPGSPSTSSKVIPHDIQILELHNKNPIVIYRNQQFQCSWTENIGTELLFIKHSDISDKSREQFPVVRELPGEVDLLAISGVRVVGCPINLRAKGSNAGPASNQREKDKPDTNMTTQSRYIKSNHSAPDRPLRIPIGAQANEDRKAQARFLEKLAAIKVKRGEYDEVTVNAIPRKELRARKDRESDRNREKKILGDPRSSEHRKAMARAKIAELDALDAAGDGAERLQRRRAKPTSQSQKRKEIGTGKLGSSSGANGKEVGVRSASSGNIPAVGGFASGAQSIINKSQQQQSQDGENEEEDEDDDDDEDDDESQSQSNSDDEDSIDPNDEENSILDEEEEGSYGWNETGNGDMDMGGEDYEDYEMEDGEEYGEEYEPTNTQLEDVDVDMDA